MIMAMARLRSGRRRSDPRSQAGYTLLELIMGMGITAIILVPLMAWGILVMRQQPVERDGMMRTAQTGLLGSMFPSDVSIAAQAVEGMNAPWATDCDGGASVNGSVKLVMITGGASVRKLVYTVAPSPGDPSELNIWRRSCGVGSDSALTSEHRLFRGVKVGTTAVTCRSQPSDAPCREIALTTMPTTGNQPINMSATRRVDAGAVPLDVLGNPLPVAVITLESRTAGQPMKATFSGERSSVGPGRTLTYEWKLEPDVATGDTSQSTIHADFPPLAPDQPSRDFTVRLTVTDDLGASNTAFFKISATNIDPVAVISQITPNPANVGDTVTLSADPVDGIPGSYDPDGSIVRFDWMISLPQSDPEQPARQVWLSGRTASYVTTTDDIGIANVRLSVTDLQLGQSSVSAQLTIVDPNTGPTSTLPPVDTGPLMAAFTDAPSDTALVHTFDASTSAGIDDSTAFSWDFGDGSTGSGRTTTHQYPGGGYYTVKLTLTTPDSQTATLSRQVQVPGNPSLPMRVRHNGTAVLWDPVVGARRYLVDFEFRTPTDCLQLIPNQAVGLSPSPSKAIPRNPCPRSATGRARVGADSGTGTSWSNWISIPVINGPLPTTTTTTPPPVVK